MRVNRGNTGDLTELATLIKLGLLGGRNPETLQFFAKWRTARDQRGRAEFRLLQRQHHPINSCGIRVSAAVAGAD